MQSQERLTAALRALQAESPCQLVEMRQPRAAANTRALDFLCFIFLL